MAQLPATVLSNFLDAGKTAMLSHIHNNCRDKKIAFIVTNMSEINIDASMAQDAVSLSYKKEKFIEMGNGYICYTLRGHQASGWLKEMCGEHVYGIGNFSYGARRSFHAEEYYQFLHNTQKIDGQWRQSGDIARCGFAEMFWKSVPKENCPADEEYLISIHKQ